MLNKDKAGTFYAMQNGIILQMFSFGPLEKYHSRRAALAAAQERIVFRTCATVKFKPNLQRKELS